MPNHNPMNDKEKNCIFSIAEMEDGVPLLLVGFPKGAIKTMVKKKKTLNFDLSKAGFPVRLVFFHEETHADCMAVIDEHNKKQGTAYLDQRHEDFAIKEKDDDGKLSE